MAQRLCGAGGGNRSPSQSAARGVAGGRGIRAPSPEETVKKECGARLSTPPGEREDAHAIDRGITTEVQEEVEHPDRQSRSGRSRYRSRPRRGSTRRARLPRSEGLPTRPAATTAHNACAIVSRTLPNLPGEPKRSQASAASSSGYDAATGTRTLPPINSGSTWPMNAVGDKV